MGTLERLVTQAEGGVLEVVGEVSNSYSSSMLRWRRRVKGRRDGRLFLMRGGWWWWSLRAGGTGGMCLITGGTEEIGAHWVTAPVELSYLTDPSKFAVILQIFRSSETL